MKRLFKFSLRLVFFCVILVVLLGTLAFVAAWRELTQDLPPVAELLDYRPPTATRVYAADGTLIGEFFVERRYLIQLEQVPPHVKAAFLAAEDARFYAHPGVNFASILRAIKVNLERGEIAQGASTITQQVVKQLLLSPERSFERKAKELILAVELESKLTKDDILYLYLNHIYFGLGTYGISAASKTFFGKPVEELSLAQAALLAGLPKAPSRYDPLRRPEAAANRQRYVLDRMVKSGFITPAEREEALAEKVDIANLRVGAYAKASWYVEHVRRLLDEEFGPAFADLGLEVHTAVDLRLQSEAETALKEGLRTIDRRLGVKNAVQRLAPENVDAYLERQRQNRRPDGPQQAVVTATNASGLTIRTPWETGVVPKEDGSKQEGWRTTKLFRVGDVVSVDPVERGDDGVLRFSLDQDPQVEGVLIAIDPSTGQVKALVGGVDFERSEFNRAVLARRQPGSAFKPLLYAAAIDKGYTPATIVQDSPISLPAGRGQTWSPKNYNNKYMGAVPLRTALAKSLNTVSVRLALDIGLDPLRDYLRIFDFPTAFPRNYSLALGSSEVTPLELARAYGIFATLGRRFTPVFITSINDVSGASIDFPGSRPRFESVMNPATAYVMGQMLGSVVQSGTAQEARKLGRPAAGKTGTTNDSKDAWFIGYTPELLTAVWVGFDADKSLGNYTGGRAAAPIWTSFMKKALEGLPIQEFPVPENISLVQVDTATGLLAVKGRPSRLEAFVKGTEPKAVVPVASPTPGAVTNQGSITVEESMVPGGAEPVPAEPR